MSLTKATYSMIAGEIGNVLDFGLIPNDNSAGAANDAAIALAIASGKRLFFPQGTYTFNSRIKVGSVNKTSQWCGAGIRKTILKPSLSFTDTEFIRVENSTVDNDPTEKTFDVLFEDMTFDGLGADTRSAVTSILYAIYVNWAHYMKINRCEFYGFNGDASNLSVGLYMGAWQNGAPDFNQMNTIQECQFTFCSNGIISGGTNMQNQFGGDNNACTIMNTRVGGFGAANGYSIGIELKGGYTTRIVGSDVENNTIGIYNRTGYNYVSETLAEQNTFDLAMNNVAGSFVSCDACNFPVIENVDYQRSNQFGLNGYMNFMQSLGAPRNLLIDGTFESLLYNSASYGGEVKARTSDAAFVGSYNRNVLFAPGNVSSTVRANMIVDPQHSALSGWHTIVVRAKRYDPAIASALRMFIDPTTYTEQFGLGVNGSIVDYLEIGGFVLVAGDHRSGSLNEEFRIYAAFVKFNGSTVKNIPVQIQDGSAVVDFVGLFPGQVGYIPAPTNEFFVSTNIGGLAPGGSVSITDFNCFPTACPMEIDSVSSAAVRRIAGLITTLQNGTAQGFSYNTAINNVFGFNVAATATNDHIAINTQSNIEFFQRAASYPAGTSLQSRIKLLPI